MSDRSMVIYKQGESPIHVFGPSAELERLILLVEPLPAVLGIMWADDSRHVTVESCLSCDQPRIDSGEGRWCPRCQDHEGTCIRDHCLSCGGAT